MALITTNTRVLAKRFVGNGRRGPAAPGRVGVAGAWLPNALAIALFVLFSGGFVSAGGGDEECRDPAAPAGPSPSDGQTGRRTRTSLQWGERQTIQRKVVYGDDDRQDVYQVNNEALLRMSQGTCALVSPFNIDRQADGRYRLSGTALGAARDLCASEPFREQPTAAFCSGFLVSQDVVATAGHCVPAGGCDGTAFVFDYKMIDSTTAKMVIEEENVYFCEEVVGHRLSGGVDYALVRLDRPVTGRQPVEIRRSGRVPDRTPLVMVGHPSGLPQKIAGGARVRDNSASSHFVANTDSYGGNSGSPIFNELTSEVEGILVRGVADYVPEGNCYVSNHCSDEGCDGEDATRTTHFSDLLPPAGGPVVYAVYLGRCGNLESLGETGERSWIVSGLEINTEYCWQVRASNDCGSVVGAVWSFTTGEEVGPDPNLPNDSVDNAWPIEGLGGSFDDASDSASPILWWAWEAPRSGRVVFDTRGSGFDTILSAYDSARGILAENDDAYHLQSEVSFEVDGGETYYISVSGYSGATGDISLNWSLGGEAPAPGPAPGGGPVNDDLADHLEFDSSEGRATGNSDTAGDEGWEGDLFGGASVWWEWTPPTGGLLRVDTIGSDYDTTLTVLRGDSPGELSVLGMNDDSSGLQSRVEFTAEAGQSYLIRVAGYSGATGDIVLNWQVLEPSEPVDGPVWFMRSDANQDGLSDMSDAVEILAELFLGEGPGRGCPQSLDVDDNGAVELTDSVYLLTFLFNGGDAPPAPFGFCGVDFSDGGLVCETYAPCGE
jgi:hypothetical protein